MITTTPRKQLSECINLTLTHTTHRPYSTRTFLTQTLNSVLSRDRLVVRTLRCGRSNPGSNPGHGMDKIFGQSGILEIQIFILLKKTNFRV